MLNFVERGISGPIPVGERPKGSELWAMLERGDTIIAPKLDRLLRSALDALQTVEGLRDKGVSLVLLDLGGDISGNGMSKLFLTIAAAFAEAARDRIKERIAQVKRDQRARARYLGGTAPWGSQRGPDGELVPNPEKQAAITRMRQLRAEGLSLHKIMDRMEGEGISVTLPTLMKLTAPR